MRGGDTEPRHSAVDNINKEHVLLWFTHHTSSRWIRFYFEKIWPSIVWCAARRGAVCAKITSNFGADISRCPTGFNFPSEITSLLNIVLYKYRPGGPAGTRHTSHLHFILYSAQSPWCRYWVLEFSSSRLKAISGYQPQKVFKLIEKWRRKMKDEVRNPLLKRVKIHC